MGVLVIGLVLFLGAHVFVTMRGPRAAVIARIGEWPYKGLMSLVSLVGLVLIGYGFGQYRATGWIDVWSPPRWTHYVTQILMWPASICVVAAYIRGNIWRTLKHPMLVGVKTWAVAHLISNGDLGSIVLFGSFLAWAVYDRITLKRRDRSRRAADSGRRTPQRHHRAGGRHAALSRARPRLPSPRRRRTGFRQAGVLGSSIMSAQERNQAADRARHPRPQGRRADRLAHLLPRAYRAPARSPLRSHPGRRFARHGDARARDHRAGHARHDDPAGPRGDARLASARSSSSTCRSAPTRPPRSRPSCPRRG